MTSAPATNELLAERAKLIAANEAATGWGAAVGARLERIIEIDRKLRAAATPSAQGAGLLPDASPGNGAEKVREAALRLLVAEDNRQTRLHEILETIREQIRTGVEPEHRPDGLFKNIQDAVYAMRGRTPLMDDMAILAALHSTSAAGETTSSDGGVLLDAYNGWSVDRLKARCRELVRAVSEWQHAAMSAASEGGNRLSNVIEPYKSKIGRMIEAYTDDDEPRPSEAIPADVREESSKQYRDAVDRVNRLTDREIANVLAMKEACHCFDDTSRRYCTDKHRCFRAEAQSASPEAKAEGEQHVATVTYTNWRGETSLRRIIPKAVRYGVTAWHPQPQWLMLAWDDDKQADREFALKDFGVKAEGGRSEPDSRTQK